MKADGGRSVHQRTRTIKAGPMVYVECYPVWDTKRALAARKEVKKEAHAKAQAKLDAKNREKKVEYLTNNNFGASDIILTAEYPLNGQPDGAEQAKPGYCELPSAREGCAGEKGPAADTVYLRDGVDRK